MYYTLLHLTSGSELKWLRWDGYLRQYKLTLATFENIRACRHFINSNRLAFDNNVNEFILANVLFNQNHTKVSKYTIEPKRYEDGDYNV